MVIVLVKIAGKAGKFFSAKNFTELGFMANNSQLDLLRRSVEEWNRWRRENPQEKVDLSNADLEGINLAAINSHPVDLEGANLRKANLFHAHLTHVNFRGANLSNTNFNTSYLTDVSFASAYLGNTNFSSSCLDRVDFRDADLARVQALYANFQNVNLTGACIKDWNINSETQFSNAICEYIYLKHKRQNDKYVFAERRPHDPNKTFAPGDFARLVQQANETLDLIFSEGIDWNAFAQTFQGLQIQTDSNELSIQSIEKKRDGSFVVKVDVPLTVDKAALEKEFWARYQPLLEAKEAEYRALLQEKEIKHQQQRIQDFQQHNTNLNEMVKILGSITINVKAEAMAGDNIRQEGNFGIGHMSGGEIKDSKVAGILNEAEQQNLAQAAAEIQQLLEQLEKSYPTETMAGKMELASEAISQIENNRTFKERVVKSLKAGGVSAFEQLLSHPAASFVIAALKEWRE
ncbi:MAG: pentapeptide repeat-containing protein [Okeania sp. SIO2D1]|nr:pentapeptide repeat-containing protein [Okeania sp. SIO2D1]